MIPSRYLRFIIISCENLFCLRWYITLDNKYGIILHNNWRVLMHWFHEGVDKSILAKTGHLLVLILYRKYTYIEEIIYI